MAEFEEDSWEINIWGVVFNTLCLLLYTVTRSLYVKIAMVLVIVLSVILSLKELKQTYNNVEVNFIEISEELEKSKNKKTKKKKKKN